jgi:polynucleotide 5'-hydroxyl-kinase GRC3/NOL9
MGDTVNDFIKDSGIVEDLKDPGKRVIMVTGGADTGKTTLVECIADMCAEQSPVGIVDLDMGQSHIGPPTTIAWGKIAEGFKKWTCIATEDYYFTGAYSPAGNLLPAVVGAKLLTERALSSCQKVVVDTTGLIAEPVGRVLKQYKVDLLSPQVILALERSSEMGHILDTFMHQAMPQVYRLSVPDSVKSKSITRRIQYREEKFKYYFAHSRMIEVSCDAVGIRFTRSVTGLNRVDLKNRIVSFRDARNRDLAVGVIERLNVKDKKLVIRSPLKKDLRVSTVVVGMAKIQYEDVR